MFLLPQLADESRIVGVPLPPRDFGVGREYLPYGAYHLAARYCGLSRPTRPFEGEWQHGWNPTDTVSHPEVITSTDGLSRHRRATHTFLVARDDEATALRRFGYRSVHAVGLPIVYQPKVKVDRLPGSLLVMPVHSLEYTQHAWNFEQYADEVDALRDRFSQVVVCVSTSCFKRAYWVPAFEQRGIPVVSGADIFDVNTYARLACLFERFEFMTTNGFGSHLVYAGLFGTKPSIHGTVAHFQRQDFRSDAFYQHNPDVLDMVVDLSTPESLRQRFPHLFVRPWEAASQTDWAGFQVGVPHKQTPEALRNLLGWDRSHRRTPGLKAITAKAAGRAHRLAARIADPETHEQTAAVTALKRTTAGQLVQSDVPCRGFESTDGPRLACELEIYFYGEALRVLVNPPEGQAVDLAPREGASVLALARHHPDRAIYFLDAGDEQGVLLRKNLACADANGKIAAVKDLRSVADSAVVVRLAVDATSWHEAAATVSRFPGCRLLFLEGTGDAAEYFGPLLKTLTDLRFLPRLDRFLFSSIQESGFLAARTMFSLPLTRSGLDLRPQATHGG